LGFPTPRYLIGCFLFVTGFMSVFMALADSALQIKNPFYSTPEWRLWHLDQQPVSTGDKVLIPLAARKRLLPVDPDPSAPGDRFLAYRKGDWPGRKYAGIWDDVYASVDDRHSFMPADWSDGYGNSAILRGQHMDLVLSARTKSISELGLTFTSQSTTGMGHDLTDSFAEIDNLERQFCFANILRAGPAHISYREYRLDRIDDQYDAIVPCLFNSAGSSKSEVNALAKMMIAGGYLPTATKYRLKENGLYIPALLYIWKAGLPYEAAYTNELRHRVAYASSGRSDDKYLARQVELNQVYHRYDESRHLRNMVDLAKSMDDGPPIALFRSARVEGGSLESVNKTTIRVHQRSGQTIRLTVSADESFDLQDRPLTYRWDLLYGNTAASIEPTEDGRDAVVTVPFNARLPKGRTVVMLTVNNGQHDSNPAMINIFRLHGKDNLRPSLSGLSDTTVLSGETVRFDILSEDPEGFPTSLYRWANEVGELNAHQFHWKTPLTRQVMTETVSIIASDGTGGYNSEQVQVTVTPVVAVLNADKTSGAVPLIVKFSAAGSRDIDGRELTYSWRFDDGQIVSGRSPEHVFRKPGFHEVTLTARGPNGQHTASQRIHVEPAWTTVLRNGWKSDGIDTSDWTINGPAEITLKRKGGSGSSLVMKSEKGVPRDTRISLTSVRSFSAPFSVEATFRRTSTRRGAGIEVLGNLIGKLDTNAAPDTSIGHQKGDGTWNYQPVTRDLSRPQAPSKLLLYVTPVPGHPGRIRYSGRLTTPLETAYFRLDDQAALTDKIRLLARSGGGQFEVSELVVSQPD
jgi:hypothetical protein